VLALLAFAAGPVVYLQRRMEPGGRLTGATGPFAADQLQYLTWMRAAADHGGLASNLYDLGPSTAVFAHPMVAVSALLLALGASPHLALLLWVPVAAVTLAVGVWTFAHRHLVGPTWQVGVAAAVGVAFATPTPWLHEVVTDPRGARLGGAAAGQLTPAVQLWGYTPAAIAIGLVPLCLLVAERVLASDRAGHRRAGVRLAIGAALAGWLHPWEGALLVVIVSTAAVWTGWEAAKRAALPVAAALLPLAYYALLPRLSDDWAVARAAEAAGPRPLVAALAAVAPLALVAAAGLERPSRDDPAAERLLLLWPLAAAVMFVVVPAFPSHALITLPIPLAVLAVRGLRRAGSAAPAVAIGGVAVLLVPGMVDTIRFEGDQLRADLQPHALSADERAALEYLDREAAPGGVIASVRLGSAVPGFTGRAVWVGHPYWTPDFERRALAIDAVLAGAASDDDEAAVADAGAAFLLTACDEGASLPPTVARMVIDVRRFGCVAVHRFAP
jgi:hypothetical protein